MIPFSHEQFLDLFGAYNATFWPVALACWVATAGLAWQWIGQRQVRAQWLFALLAMHWAWSGAVYHLTYFTGINPAASVFGAAFLLQAVLFVRLAMGAGDAVLTRRGRPSAAGMWLIVYGLAYPGLGVAAGLTYPRMPLFAVPCPTTLVTAGWLIGTSEIRWPVRVVPFAWAVVGSSAAFVLGIPADLGLVAAAIGMAADAVMRRTPRPEPAG